MVTAMKKIICLMLSVILLITMMPMAVFAADEKESVDYVSDLLNNLIDFAIGDVDSFSRVNRLKLIGFKSYTALGDSTVFGYGMKNITGGKDAFENHYGYGVVNEFDEAANPDDPKNGDAYPIALAKKFGIKLDSKACDHCDAELYLDCNTRTNHFAQLSMGILRPEDILSILTDNWFNLKKLESGIASKSYFAKNVYRGVIPSYGDCKKTARPEDSEALCRKYFFEMQKTYRNNIRHSDLVTLSAGGNSVGNMIMILQSCAPYTASEMLDYELSKYIVSPKLLNSALDLMSSLLEKAGVSLSGLGDFDISTIVKFLLYFYISVGDSIQETADAIHRINDDAIIVLTGLYNPADSLRFIVKDSGLELELGRALSLITNGLNRQFRRYAMLHSSYCAYVDISDAELILDDLPNDAITFDQVSAKIGELIVVDNGSAVHENADGHEFIADQIYKTLYRRNIGLFR